MTKTWKRFLTVGFDRDEFGYSDKTKTMDWNTEETYKNVSPGKALRFHKEMFPGSIVKVVSV